MGVSIADLPPEYQKQVREKLAAEEACRAAKAKGGIARAEALSPDRRTQIARDAAKARWSGQPKRNKYGAVRTPYKSIQGFERVYDSKGEADYAATLDRGIQAGLVQWWIPQPKFPLPGERRSYRGDFLVVWADSRTTVVDYKGADTAHSKDRRKEVKAHFGIDVEIVRTSMLPTGAIIAKGTAA